MSATGYALLILLHGQPLGVPQVLATADECNQSGKQMVELVRQTKGDALSEDLTYLCAKTTLATSITTQQPSAQP